MSYLARADTVLKFIFPKNYEFSKISNNAVPICLLARSPGARKCRVPSTTTLIFKDFPKNQVYQKEAKVQGGP